MFERPKSGERAILVRSDTDSVETRDNFAEFRELALSAGARPVAMLTGRRRTPDSRYFIGPGKAQEVADLVANETAELVLVDHQLSPAQERNLEKLTKCRVLDRTGLILDIFAQRASSFEGKLQVELAQLKHMSTRLVRGWTHLERQKGGIGLRGPGEKQLETDRRLLAVRIKQINRRLAKVRKQREQGRASRRKAGVPSVALVGYTNAGKSTLFNRLTEAGIYVADQLFATLDPTIRKLKLSAGIELVLVDTVGFISDLPHELVDAFRATLLETQDADLLLHLVDWSDDERLRAYAGCAVGVAGNIGADSVPQLVVANKIDLCGLPAGITWDEQGKACQVSLSAQTGVGIDSLFTALEQRLSEVRERGWIFMEATEGRLRGILFAAEAVIKESPLDTGGWLLQVDLDESLWRSLVKRENLGGRLLTTEPVILAADSQAQYNSRLA